MCVCHNVFSLSTSPPLPPPFPSLPYLQSSHETPSHMLGKPQLTVSTHTSCKTHEQTEAHTMMQLHSFLFQPKSRTLPPAASQSKTYEVNPSLFSQFPLFSSLFLILPSLPPYLPPLPLLSPSLPLSPLPPLSLPLLSLPPSFLKCSLNLLYSQEPFDAVSLPPQSDAKHQKPKSPKSPLK